MFLNRHSGLDLPLVRCGPANRLVDDLVELLGVACLPLLLDLLVLLPNIFRKPLELPGEDVGLPSHGGGPIIIGDVVLVSSDIDVAHPPKHGHSQLRALVMLLVGLLRLALGAGRVRLALQGRELQLGLRCCLRLGLTLGLGSHSSLRLPPLLGGHLKWGCEQGLSAGKGAGCMDLTQPTWKHDKVLSLPLLVCKPTI